MTINIEDFVQALARYEKPVRKKATFALEIITKVCPRALSNQSSMPQDFFQKNARSVYEYAETEDELEALCVCFFYAYEIQSEQHPNLIPPKQFFPVKRQMPLIHEGMPKLELQHLLNDELDTQLNQPHKLGQQVRWMMFALLLARQTDTRTKKALKALLNFDLNKSVLLVDAKRAVLPVNEGALVYLDAIGLLILQNLQADQNHNSYSRNIEGAFATWVDHCVQRHPKNVLANTSLPEALNALTYCTRVPAIESLGSLTTPLAENRMIDALSGNHSADFGDAPADTKKRRSRAFEKVEAYREAKDVEDYARLAFNPCSASNDQEAIQHLRNSLAKFVELQPDMKRNGLPFKTLKVSLLKQLGDIINTDGDISAVTQIIITYCIDLFLHGSAWKDRLAVSTIQTYLSTITAFASTVWIDEKLLQDAQHQMDAKIELTELVADGLSAINAPDKQGTVLNFLQYVSQTKAITLFDDDELEYQGAGLANIRAHYISPLAFETVCNRFLNELNSLERQHCIQFVRLCYSLGLRHQEAERLQLDDIDFTNHAAYITQYFKRKTKAAIRRIPLCFMKTQHINALEDYTSARKLRGDSSMFDSTTLATTLPLFIANLREFCRDDTLVPHSLRHSAANNMLFQLSLTCLNETSSLPKRYAFLQHSIFSEEQCRSISAALITAGRPASPYLPILDILANLLGHVSPTVTASSYLHLADILFFELSAQRQAHFSPEQLSHLITSNQYRFEVKKEYQKYVSASDIDGLEKVLFKSAAHGLTAAKKLPLSQGMPEPMHQPNKLAFSDYVRALIDYKKHSSHITIFPSLHAHFDKVALQLNSHFLESMHPRDFAVWQRLFERISHTEWLQINCNAIDALHDALKTSKVSDKRSAKRYLRAMSLLGLHSQTIKLSSQDESNPQKKDWVQLITSAGHRALKVDDVSSSTFLHTRPYRLRWKPWDDLNKLLPIIKAYTVVCRLEA